MGSPIGAMRDPIFYRWHGFVESVFKEYKNRLPGYSEADLSFPGVTSVTATVQSQGGDVNTFYTYREMAKVNMDSLDSPSPGSRMSMQYLRMNHRPFTWSIVINSNLRVRAPAIVRVFMMPVNGADDRATIHMDHFFMDLNPGENLISRDELEAPHLSKSRWSLSQLQNSLMNGQVGWRQFSWGGCGWPRHLNIPRGTEAGMAWNMVVMVSQVLPVDIPRIGGWAFHGNLAWSYCGVRRGVVPDSRPLGFPTDRDFGDIRNLVRGRDNWAVVPVTIVHGTSN
jgi:tyrosinase